jgi:predicted nucleic acid-binding protein
MLLDEAGDFPILPVVPPGSDNPAADCVSLAFDADKFALFISPHILENIARVMDIQGHKAALIGKVLETVIEIVHLSGGSVVVPPRFAYESKDFEDNLVLDLLKYTDSKVLVTSDQGLLAMNPWKFRLIMQPREFLDHML